MPFEASPVLVLRNLSKRFGGIVAVDNLSFSIYGNRITSIIGPNGAGKTTVVNMISGFIFPNCGSIHYKGYEITGLQPFQISRMGIARTFQDLRIFARMTVLDNVLVGMKVTRGEGVLSASLRPRAVAREEKKNVEKAEELLGFVDLLDNKDQIAGNQSFGQQKLLSLARALATGAELLLLDEPTSGLPNDMVEKMLSLVKSLVREGKTICLIEHDMEVVMDLSDWIIVMNQGRFMTEGPPEEVEKNPHVVDVYLGA